MKKLFSPIGSEAPSTTSLCRRSYLNPWNHRILSTGIACAVYLSSSLLLSADTLYWDGNGSASGAGTAPAGTWGVDSFWSTSEQGTLTPSAYSAGSDVVFTAGDDSTGTYTVTVNGTQNANGLLFRSPGNLAMTGGTVQIGSNGLSVQSGTATISSVLQLMANQTWNIGSDLTLTQNGNINGGTHTVTKSGAGSVVITSAGTAFNTLVIEEGRVNIRGAGTLGLQSRIVLANTEGAVLDFTGAVSLKGMGTLSGGGALGGNVILGTTVSFYASAGNQSTFAGTISGAGGLSMLAGGLQELTGLNTYTGVTTIARNGTFSINSIGNVGGGASALGAPTSTYGGTIQLGHLSDGTGGTLVYTGTGHSSNRVINLQGSTGTGRIEANGTGALVFTSGLTATGTGSKTFNLSGTNAGNNTIGGAIVDNSAVNKTALLKTGEGKWILGGQNTYTGNTLIQEGTLFINGSTAAASIAKLSQGATLGGGGTIHGAVEAEGEVMPGNGFGVLSVGSIAFESTSSLSIQLGRDGDELRNGRLASAGAISITGGADLRLTLATGLQNASQGDTFFILTTSSGSAVSGAFTHLNGVATDLLDGSTFHWNSLDWVISYGADFSSSAMIGGYDVAIQAVPEPGSLALGVVGVGLALAWMKRRNGSRIDRSV